MSARRFLDTNVLIYAFGANDQKSETAKATLAAGGVISVQVLNEFANASRKKLKLEWEEIAERLAVVDTLLDSPTPITVELHAAAVKIAARRRIAFYDALIVASAQASKCAVLVSEDFQHGAKFGDVEVQNPFV
jgi:predicted nucleic acid-binding protein